jgi:hypothetical protein
LQQQQQSVVGSRSSGGGSGIRMALAVEKKFVTTKSEEIFTAAKVLHTYSLCCLPPCLFSLSLSLSLIHVKSIHCELGECAMVFEVRKCLFFGAR